MLYNGNMCTYRSKSLQKLTFSVSNFIAVCMTEW